MPWIGIVAFCVTPFNRNKQKMFKMGYQRQNQMEIISSITWWFHNLFKKKQVETPVIW